MDLQRQRKMDGFDSGWTNKKHLSFLDSMEASFVRRMFENDDRCFCPKPRLDRYLPDGADSTLDFKHHIAPGKSLDLTRDGSKAINVDNASKKKRRKKGPSVQYNPSRDQVVPFLGSAKGDEGETEKESEVWRDSST